MAADYKAAALEELDGIDRRHGIPPAPPLWRPAVRRLGLGCWQATIIPPPGHPPPPCSESTSTRRQAVKAAQRWADEYNYPDPDDGWEAV